MIDKNSPIPIYHQLEKIIRQQIETDQLKAGDVLPSEREYAEINGISRMTVRQAITNLVNDRMLYRAKGKGTFVTEKKFEQNIQGLTSFTEDMKARGMKPSNQLLSFEIIPACSILANELGIKEHGPVYEIKRVRTAQGIPMALERTYISANLIQGLTKNIAEESLYAYIEQTLGLKISNGFQVIEATLANDEEVRHLDIREDSPILLIERTTYLDDQTVFEVAKTSYRADRYKFMIDLERR